MGTDPHPSFNDGTSARSWREDERQINLYLLPEWRNRKVKDITRRDVRDLVEGIAERRLRKGTTDDGQEKVGAPIMANRVLSLVKKMFNFALDREWTDANPAARLKPVSPETRRDRVLSADEIRTLWRELNAEHHRIATMFRTQLLTAQRPGEVSRMRWARRRSFDEGRRIVEGGREASLMVGTRDAVPGRSQR